jgi:hypothetical protein
MDDNPIEVISSRFKKKRREMRERGTRQKREKMRKFQEDLA